MYHLFNKYNVRIFPHVVRCVIYLKLLTFVMQNQCTFCAIGTKFLSTINVTFIFQNRAHDPCCLLLSFHPEGLVSILDQFMWDTWQTKWKWEKFFSKY